MPFVQDRRAVALASWGGDLLKYLVVLGGRCWCGIIAAGCDRAEQSAKYKRSSGRRV